MAAAVAPVLAVASIATTVAGGIASAQAGKEQAASQAAMYTYQAGIAQQNEKISKQNAAFALQQGEEQAQQEGLRNRYQVGQIKAAEAASGLDVNKGTSPLVVRSQQEVGQLNEATTRGNAQKAAYDFDVQGWQFGQQSKLYGMAAANTKAAAPLAYEASILGTAGNVASKWMQFNQSGVLGPTVPSNTTPGF